MFSRERHESLQPGEIVTAAFGLVIVPAETPAPRSNLQPLEQLEIRADLVEVVAGVIVLEDGE